MPKKQTSWEDIQGKIIDLILSREAGWTEKLDTLLKTYTEQIRKEERERVVEMMEEMPLKGKVMKLRIGETPEGLKFVQKLPGHENATMQDVRDYNRGVEEWEKGYHEAMNRIKKWRNEQYLKFKNLS